MPGRLAEEYKNLLYLNHPGLDARGDNWGEHPYHLAYMRSAEALFPKGTR